MQAEMSEKQISDIREGKAHGRVDLGERRDKQILRFAQDDNFGEDHFVG
jgi:hypothetical protein